MGIVEEAPKKIVWRAIEYYKQNKVLEVHENGKDCYSAIVAGSGKTKYDVFIDVKHPKKCTCTCPFAKENDVICVIIQQREALAAERLPDNPKQQVPPRTFHADRLRGGVTVQGT